MLMSSFSGLVVLRPCGVHCIVDNASVPPSEMRIIAAVEFLYLN